MMWYFSINMTFRQVSDVAIIIVNYKMKADIVKCLASLFPDFSGDSLNVRVTVVDNASGDGIDDFLKQNYPGVQCIVLPDNKGFGHANNAGIKATGAEYYFILNPDTRFLPGARTIRRLYNWMETHPKVGLIGPKLVYPDGSLQNSCFRFPAFWQPLYSRTSFGTRSKGQGKRDKFLMRDFDHHRTQPVDWIMGSAMFARGSAIKEVGFFDDRFFMYYEDSDWCRRFWDFGWPVYYVHDIVIEHAHRRGSAKVPGVLSALIKNKLARVHLASWLKYMWKWRGAHKL